MDFVNLPFACLWFQQKPSLLRGKHWLTWRTWLIEAVKQLGYGSCYVNMISLSLHLAWILWVLHIIDTMLVCLHWCFLVIMSRMDPVSIAYHWYNTGLFILMFSCHCLVFQAPRDRLRHLRFRDLITVGQEVSRISTCSLEMMMIMVIKMVMRMMTGYSDGYDNDDDW